ncbi:hypothetical protein B0H14DRAFT_2614576 [Mycena olivaceomarginata]|nr:hypothetical protein B0H14DRAFT_2614576 [Mycena olivaceomarginata]
MHILPALHADRHPARHHPSRIICSGTNCACCSYPPCHPFRLSPRAPPSYAAAAAARGGTPGAAGSPPPSRMPALTPMPICRPHRRLGVLHPHAHPAHEQALVQTEARALAVRMAGMNAAMGMSPGSAGGMGMSVSPTPSMGMSMLLKSPTSAMSAMMSGMSMASPVGMGPPPEPELAEGDSGVGASKAKRPWPCGEYAGARMGAAASARQARGDGARRGPAWTVAMLPIPSRISRLELPFLFSDPSDNGLRQSRRSAFTSASTHNGRAKSTRPPSGCRRAAPSYATSQDSRSISPSSSAHRAPRHRQRVPRVPMLFAPPLSEKKNRHQAVPYLHQPEVRQRRQRQRKKAHNALIHLQLPRRGERKEKKKIGVQKQSKTENTTKEERKGEKQEGKAE